MRVRKTRDACDILRGCAAQATKTRQEIEEWSGQPWPFLSFCPVPNAAGTRAKFAKSSFCYIESESIGASGPSNRLRQTTVCWPHGCCQGLFLS